MCISNLKILRNISLAKAFSFKPDKINFFNSFNLWRKIKTSISRFFFGKNNVFLCRILHTIYISRVAELPTTKKKSLNIFVYIISCLFTIYLYYNSRFHSLWTSNTMPSAKRWVALPKVVLPVKAAAAAAASSSESTSSSSSPPVVTMTACSPLAEVMVCCVMTRGVVEMTPACRFRWWDRELTEKNWKMKN